MPFDSLVSFEKIFRKKGRDGAGRIAHGAPLRRKKERVSALEVFPRESALGLVNSVLGPYNACGLFRGRREPSFPRTDTFRPTTTEEFSMSNPAIAARMGELIANESVQKALAVAKEEAPRALAEQIAIAQIPSPTFEESRRAEEIARLLREYGLTDVVIDPSGNVVGRRPGRGAGPVVAIAAHTDTVFPMETDVTVRSEGNLHYGPGIGDNASGLRSMLQVLRMLEAAKIETAGDILFVGTVGEEGNGDIRGAKALFDGSRKIDAFVALDMETVARVQTGATGAHRWRLAVDGPGGHSWLDYGRVPSAVHAIGRAIAKIANLELPEDPKTSYTVGTIKGGTTVNTIAAHCEVDVDMRSVAMEELMKVEETILAAFEEAVAEENARWTKAPESAYVKLTKTKIGDRPAGQRPADCPAVNAALEGAKALGIEVTWTGSSSTDCNMPMSLGIPAVCLGTGGHTYNEHSLKEYFDSTDMHLGPQLALLTVLGITGLA